MRMLASLVCAALAGAVLAACGTAQSPGQVRLSLQKATAEALAGVQASEVEVVTSERSPAKWTWRARANGAAYTCDADNQMRLPSCVAES